MKTKIVMAACMIVWGTTQAQDFTDALRYSEDVPEGNARYAGMAGSMSALGANLSAVSSNPAGLALYQTGVFEFGLGGLYNSTASKYLGQTNNGLKAGMTFSNLGIAGCQTDLVNDLGVKNVNYAFTVNRLNDYNGKTVIEGTNANSSMTDDFVNLLNSKKQMDSYNAYENLGWDSYLIGWDSANNKYYSDLRLWDKNGNMHTQFGEKQMNTVVTSGNKMEYGFSFGANFNSIVYLGGSLNIQSINYSRTNTYTERDQTNIPFFDNFTLTTNLKASGSGVNLKLGAIVRPIKDVRLGIAIHTPTVLSISETYDAKIVTNLDMPINGYTNYNKSAEQAAYNYTVMTPFRTIASLGVTANKSFSMNFDYELVDYSIAQFGMKDDASFESDRNKEIAKTLNLAQNLRAGAELWFGQFGLRGGAALYSNPYAKNIDDSYTSYRVRYTGGFSIRSKNTYFDLAYMRTINKGDQILYNDYSGNAVLASTTQNANKIIATIGFKF